MTNKDIEIITEKIAQMNRACHWQQAKGHLNAALEFYPQLNDNGEGWKKFKKVQGVIEEFIEEIDGEGMIE